MNGKQAKRLRKVARDLGLPTETKYAFAGALRRRPSVKTSDGRTVRGAPIRRPVALQECERRAAQEAKKLYKEHPGG